MNTTALGHPPTAKALSSVATIRPRQHVPPRTVHVKAVLSAIAACSGPQGWRRKDLLRSRTHPLDFLFALVRELKDGGAPLAELEGVSVSIYNAMRALMTEGLTVANESLADALVVEQEREGVENIATLAALQHPSIGTYRALRQATLNEIEASRHIIDLLDAELLRMEAAR